MFFETSTALPITSFAFLDKNFCLTTAGGRLFSASVSIGWGALGMKGYWFLWCRLASGSYPESILGRGKKDIGCNLGEATRSAIFMCACSLGYAGLVVWKSKQLDPNQYSRCVLLP